MRSVKKVQKDQGNNLQTFKCIVNALVCVHQYECFIITLKITRSAVLPKKLKDSQVHIIEGSLNTTIKTYNTFSSMPVLTFDLYI